MTDRERPSRMAQYQAGAERLSDAVDAYRAERGLEPAPAPTKPNRPRLSPADRPTEIAGYPLNDSPPQDIPDYGNIARVKAMQEQRRERRRKNGTATLDPIGAPELRKQRELRAWRAAE
jgi:hypothetical protein